MAGYLKKAANFRQFFCGMGYAGILSVSALMILDWKRFPLSLSRPEFNRQTVTFPYLHVRLDKVLHILKQDSIERISQGIL